MNSTIKTWTLTDNNSHRDNSDWSLSPSDVGSEVGPFRVTRRRLHGGLSEGVDLVEIDNGSLVISVLPTRGMGLWDVKSGDWRIGWDSPVRGPVHPGYVPLYDPSGLGWLDGFDELVARCGLLSNGAPESDSTGKLLYPLHGRIANQPAHHVTVSFDSSNNEIELTGVVDESRFHFHKLRLTSVLRTRLGESSFTLRDRVENFAGVPSTFQLLYHNNFGPPLLESGAKFVAAVEELMPRNDHSARSLDRWAEFGEPTPGAAEQVYFMRLAADAQQRTHVVLHNRAKSRGIGLGFSVEQLPCFSLWKNEVALADGYVTGLEPGTNFPNPRSFEEQQQRVVTLDAGASREFELDFEIYTTSAAVAAGTDRVAGLQTDTCVHDAPQPNWCAG